MLTDTIQDNEKERTRAIVWHAYPYVILLYT